MSNAMVLLTPEELDALVERAVRKVGGAGSKAPQEPEVLTREMAADLLQIHANVVSRYVRDLGLPGHKIGGEWRFLRSEVIAWVAAHKESA